MSPRAKIVRDLEKLFYGIVIHCPGCNGSHLLPVNWLPEGESEESPRVEGKPHWSFDGNFDQPTFHPSLLIRYTIAGEGEHVCHTMIQGGRIQYLGDCTHALKGQTVDLPEMDG